MAKYHKWAVIREAEQFKNDPESVDKILALAGTFVSFYGNVPGNITGFVTTPNGAVRIHDGDWIVKNNDADFYPIAADEFEKLYDVKNPVAE